MTKELNVSGDIWELLWFMGNWDRYRDMVLSYGCILIQKKGQMEMTIITITTISNLLSKIYNIKLLIPYLVFLIYHESSSLTSKTYQ